MQPSPYLCPMSQPLLILVMGLPGTGKSYFARHLAEKIGAEYLNTDMIRDNLGLRGQYDAASKQKVYDRLYREAEQQLKEGITVIVDGTFHQRERRKELRAVAQANNALLQFIVITAKEELIKERTARKRAYSEADFEVYQKVKESFDPIDEDHLTIESKRDNLEEMLEEAGREVEKWKG